MVLGLPRQVRPALLAKFQQDIELAALRQRPYLAKRSIGLEIGLDDRLQRVFRGADDPSRRDQTHSRNQGIDADEVLRVVLLVAQRIGVEPTGFRDEVAEQLLLPG